MLHWFSQLGVRSKVAQLRFCMQVRALHLNPVIPHVALQHPPTTDPMGD